METEIVDGGRKERGLEIAKNFKIRGSSKGFIVPSQSGHGNYLVQLGIKNDCNCPDCQTRGVKCKHQWAVEFMVKGFLDSDGNALLQVAKRITYAQDWQAYDKAQTNEKVLFMKFLDDLCGNIENPEYKFGRPKKPLSEMIFLSALKVYSTFSLRRFMTDMRDAKTRGYITQPVNYSTVALYMEKEELTPLLKDLIILSSKPLTAVETRFAVDSSGFSTTRFARYFSYKHEKDMKYKTWLKAHICCGVKTNIITSVEVTAEREADSPRMIPLVEKTSENFKIEEVSADKAYLSRENMTKIDELGGVPYIPFKTNTTGRQRGSPTWRKMYLTFELKRDEFLAHYHLRSNVETTFHMVKSKFGDSLRSKTERAQINEVLLKMLCHNIVCLIHEMFELGIEASFK